MQSGAFRLAPRHDRHPNPGPTLRAHGQGAGFGQRVHRAAARRRVSRARDHRLAARRGDSGRGSSDRESAPLFRYVKSASRSGTRDSFRVGAEAFPSPPRLRFPQATSFAKASQAKQTRRLRGRVLFRLGFANRSCRRFAPRNWHGCPLHATKPKQNAEFWRTKIAANQARDRLVTRTLRARGWRVLRLWEHELSKRHERRLLARLRRVGLTGVSK